MGEASVNHAEATGKARWAIDESTIIDLRMKDVTVVAVHEYESDDIYASRMQDWEKADFMDFTRRGGALQRYLPISKFVISRGKTKL